MILTKKQEEGLKIAVQRYMSKEPYTCISGYAGTGKSSTIKAVVNEYYEEGLRILEIRKDQLMDMPRILDELSENPLKFIIFIDDLSFQKGDDNFSALKAILEGKEQEIDLKSEIEKLKTTSGAKFFDEAQNHIFPCIY